MGQEASAPAAQPEAQPSRCDDDGQHVRDIVVKRKNASERLGVELGTDLVIAGLIQGGCGMNAGLEVGMKVTSINGTPIQTEVDGIQAVQNSGLHVTFTVHDVTFQTIRVVRKSMTERLGIELRSDLYIEALHPGAAISSGLRAGMKVVAINGSLVRDEQHALEMLQSAGLILEFKVQCDRKPTQATPLPPPKTSEVDIVIEDYQRTEKLGIDLSPQMVIINLTEGTAAAGSGLKVGMRVIRINNIAVDTASEMTLLLQSCSGKVVITVGEESVGPAEMLLQPIVAAVSSLPVPFHAFSDTVVQCLPATLIKCDVMRTAEADSIPSSQLAQFGGPINVPVDDTSPPAQHTSRKEGWEPPSPSELVDTT